MMKHCFPICAVAAGLIGSQIPFFYRTQQELIMHEFNETLSPEQKAIYQNIVQERFRLFAIGSLIGLTLGLAYLWYAMRTKQHTGMRICVAFSILIGAPYLYYNLAPKSDWMLLHLDNDEQIAAWLDVYRYMKRKCHLGFLLGVVGYLLLCIFFPSK
jgi:Sec-independent protein secretion pathway component TatC